MFDVVFRPIMLCRQILFLNFYRNLITCKSGAPGSTPVSNTVIVTPWPSYSGHFVRNDTDPVSFFGRSPCIRTSKSTSSAIIELNSMYIVFHHLNSFLINFPLKNIKTSGKHGSLKCKYLSSNILHTDQLRFYKYNMTLLFETKI